MLNSHQLESGMDKQGKMLNKRQNLSMSGPKGHISIGLKPGEQLQESTKQLIQGVTGLTPKQSANGQFVRRPMP